VVLYPEVAGLAASWLERNLGQPRSAPCRSASARRATSWRRWRALAGLDPAPLLDDELSRLPWYSRSVDSNYLTGKRVFIFGDATHAIAAARVAATELGFAVVGLGTYSREFAREVREAAKGYGIEALITDDYLEVEARDRRAAARAGAGHADGAARGQAPRRALRRHLRADPCAGLPRPAFPADGA
jgi:light-independent protochlorophyllide reductase subunit B